MTRRYHDRIDVRTDASSEAPTQFLWRGRLYVVREVLGHWVEVRPWWRAGAARALLGTDAPELPAGGPAGALALAAPPVTVERASDRTVEDGEREVWRVEASAGRLHGSGVYDLGLDPVEGTWSLARALD